MDISSSLKMGKIEFRFDKISICACPYLLFVLLGWVGSVAAEIIAKIEDFAKKKQHSVTPTVRKIHLVFVHLIFFFTRSFSSGFLTV